MSNELEIQFEQGSKEALDLELNFITCIIKKILSKLKLQHFTCVNYLLRFYYSILQANETFFSGKLTDLKLMNPEIFIGLERRKKV